MVSVEVPIEVDTCAGKNGRLQSVTHGKCVLGGVNLTVHTAIGELVNLKIGTIGE